MTFRPDTGEYPRLAVRPEEAANMLSVSRDYFDQYVKPNIEVVREGRVVLVPVRELERWIEERAVCIADL